MDKVYVYDPNLHFSTHCKAHSSLCLNKTVVRSIVSIGNTIIKPAINTGEKCRQLIKV